MPSWRHMAVITVPAAAGTRVHDGVFSSIAAGYNMFYPNIGLNTVRAHNRTQITHKHILDNDICLYYRRITYIIIMSFCGSGER